MKRARTILLMSALLLALAAPDAAAKRVLRVNEGNVPNSPEDVALKKFKQLVEERTKGEIEVRVFLGHALGEAPESMENLKRGALDLYSGDITFYSSLVQDELGPISLLYLFSDNAHLRRYLKGPDFQRAEQKLKATGIRFISTEWNGDRGPYRVFASTKPVLGPDDLKGLKKRVWPSELIIRSWRHLGAVPIVLPWQETYLALRQGTVQGVTGALNGMRSTNFTEVAPYVTETKEFPQTWPMAMSEKTWQSLTADEQQVLVASTNEVHRAYADAAIADAQKDKDHLTKTHNAVFISVNTDLFRKRMEPLYDQLIKEGVLKREIYDAINALR